jgi:hypothetical protein
VAGKKALRFVVGALLAGLFLVGLAVGSGAAQPGNRPCGAPWDAPGFEVPSRLHVMPDVVCMDLQLAGTKFRAADFESVRSQDATRYGRRQIYDRSWVVVAQDPPAGRQGDSNTPVTLTVLRYGDPGAPPYPDRSRPGRIPRLFCFNLEEAKDTAKTAGFRRFGYEDASPQGRTPIIEANWTVVGQRPGPTSGAVPKDTRIVFRVLRDDEATKCPR